MLLLLAGNRVDREITDLQLSTVCGQTGVDSCGNAGTQVTTDCGSTYQENFRLILLDNGSQCMCVRLCSVFLTLRVIYNDNLVSAICSQLISKTLHIATNQYSSYSGAKSFSKVLTFTDQLKSNTINHVVYLLCEDIYALIFF